MLSEYESEMIFVSLERISMSEPTFDLIVKFCLFYSLFEFKPISNWPDIIDT